MTVLGVVLSGRVTDLSGGGIEDLATASPAQAEAIRAAYGDGVALVFGIAAVASLLTLVAVLLIREVPLRTTVGKVEDPEPEVDRLRSIGLSDRQLGRLLGSRT